MLPNFNDLKYFIEICKMGNLTTAADRLRITQSGLTQSVHRLEEIIGTSLLIRNKRGVKPTKTGQHLLNKSIEILDNWNQLSDSIKHRETTVQGSYSLGVHQSVALYSLPLFMPYLLQENPNLEINLHHGLSRKITESVIRSEIDLGIVVNPTSHPDLVIRELCQDEVTLWRHPSLQQTETLIFEPDLTQSQALLSKLKKQKFTFTKEIHSSSLEVIRMLVESKAGAGILPTRVANDSKQSLIHFTKNQPAFKDRICLITHVARERSMSLQVIKTAISKNFK